MGKTVGLASGCLFSLSTVEAVTYQLVASPSFSPLHMLPAANATRPHTLTNTLSLFLQGSRLPGNGFEDKEYVQESFAEHIGTNPT